MKVFYWLFLCISFLLFSCNSKDSRNTKKSIIDEKVTNSTFDFSKEMSEIKTNFKRINSIKNWTVIDSVELYETTEGGQAKFYFANKQLQKVEAIYYGETGKAIIEYYLMDSKLSFVYRKEYKYNSPIYSNEFIDNEKFDLSKSEISETKNYFYKDVLFEQIKSSGELQEVLNVGLIKQQVSIKSDFNQLKQLSLIRQI